MNGVMLNCSGPAVGKKSSWEPVCPGRARPAQMCELSVCVCLGGGGA
jgi:hypothetical protein